MLERKLLVVEARPEDEVEAPRLEAARLGDVGLDRRDCPLLLRAVAASARRGVRVRSELYSCVAAGRCAHRQRAREASERTSEAPGVMLIPSRVVPPDFVECEPSNGRVRTITLIPSDLPIVSAWAKRSRPQSVGGTERFDSVELRVYGAGRVDGYSRYRLVDFTTSRECRLREGKRPREGARKRAASAPCVVSYREKGEN